MAAGETECDTPKRPLRLQASTELGGVWAGPGAGPSPCRARAASLARGHWREPGTAMCPWRRPRGQDQIHERADSTLRSSQAVPHPSTNRALCCLTSEVERDPVHSTRYGRRRKLCGAVAVPFFCPRLPPNRSQKLAAQAFPHDGSPIIRPSLVCSPVEMLGSFCNGESRRLFLTSHKAKQGRRLAHPCGRGNSATSDA